MIGNHVGPDALVWAGEHSSPSSELGAEYSGLPSRVALGRAGEGTCPYVGSIGEQMTRVGLDDQPDWLSGLKVERIASREC
jgi:hypothetical protein